MTKHLVTVHFLVESDFDLSEIDDSLKDSLIGKFDGESDSFSAWLPNGEFDEMAQFDEPTEEEAAQGYYQAQGNEADEEIEEWVEWSISDLAVSHVEQISDETLGQAIRRTERAL